VAIKFPIDFTECTPRLTPALAPTLCLLIRKFIVQEVIHISVSAGGRTSHTNDNQPSVPFVDGMLGDKQRSLRNVPMRVNGFFKFPGPQEPQIVIQQNEISFCAKNRHHSFAGSMDEVLRRWLQVSNLEALNVKRTRSTICIQQATYINIG
jgi:hypothetical protein